MTQLDQRAEAGPSRDKRASRGETGARGNDHTAEVDRHAEHVKKKKKKHRAPWNLEAEYERKGNNQRLCHASAERRNMMAAENSAGGQRRAQESSERQRVDNVIAVKREGR